MLRLILCLAKITPLAPTLCGRAASVVKVMVEG
jgi:hypothetical protein